MNFPLPARAGRRLKVAAAGSRIRELWAVVMVDDDGDEILLLQRNAISGDWLAMVTADRRAIERMRTQAEAAARENPGLKIEVRHFSCDETCKVLHAPAIALARVPALRAEER